MIPLNCANCGANLEIEPAMDVFACGYCGTKQKVERRGGTVSLRRLEESIKQVQRGTDRTASELALPRLKQELAEVEAERIRLLEAEKVAGSEVPKPSDTKHVLLGVAMLVLLFVAFAVAWWAGLAVLGAIGWYASQFQSRPDVVKAINAACDKEADRIRLQVEAHRRVLDQGPN